MPKTTQLIITILGNVISKKNSPRLTWVKGRQSRRPSLAFEKYEKKALLQLLGKPKYVGEYPVIVEMFFYRKALHVFDLDNMQSSILDILVSSRIIEDDTMRHVIPRIKGLGWALDRDNPRTEITITSY